MNSPAENITFRAGDDEPVNLLSLPFPDQAMSVKNEDEKHPFALNPFFADFDKPIRAHLIRNILPATGLVAVTGKEKSGKSFFVNHLVLPIAAGEHVWSAIAEHKISDRSREGVVIYISAEGNAGFRARKMAYAKEKGWDSSMDIRFLDVQAAPNLRDKSSLEALVKQIELSERRIVCIVVDTVARTMMGNESDSHERGCKKFCVNGHLAGNCRHFERSSNDRSKSTIRLSCSPGGVTGLASLRSSTIRRRSER